MYLGMHQTYTSHPSTDSICSGGGNGRQVINHISTLSSLLSDPVFNDGLHGHGALPKGEKRAQDEIDRVVGADRLRTQRLLALR